MFKPNHSPIEQIKLFGHNIYLKRDDLLHHDFSGNKARKFAYILEDNLDEFHNISHIISHGSNQSNAMYSLSVLSKLKNWDFTYYTNHLPKTLQVNPSGNLKYALQNGMNLIVDEYDKNSINQSSQNTLFVPEGGYFKYAQYGIKQLADEIISTKLISDKSDLKVFLPSGTGTTALYLQKFLKNTKINNNIDIEVLTVPCVGDIKYLQKEFEELEILDIYPTILSPKKKYHFGKLYPHLFELWKEIKNNTNIEFDLLYDPIGLETLKTYLQNNPNSNILYIHQGGLIGNETMIQRYEYKMEQIIKKN
jgi:1-aminocyclopropane-1-carboxylate deaminase/D-cysteine desulfhydrase-like pyridoxal-dependent ACC family enzyme